MIQYQENLSQKHPRFPVRPDYTYEKQLKSNDTGLSYASTQFFETPLDYTNTFGGHIRDWIQEILFLVLSSLSLLGVVIVLALSNGQQQPKLPFAISLNTVVSYLGVIYKGCLLGVTSSCIGQLKWCWYKNRRGLQHFDVLDGVGRSPLVAFKIFFSWKPYKWIYFGALLMLLTAFIDPFLQQIISIPLTAVEHSQASISRAQGYDAGADLADLQGLLGGNFDYGLKAAIYQGLFAPELSSNANFNCPSGNCTFPEFDSLAFCSKCTNITGQVRTSDNPYPNATEIEVPANYTFTLPFVSPITINTVVVNGAVAYGPAFVSVPFSTNLSAAAIGIENPLVAMSMLNWGRLDTSNFPPTGTGNYSTQLPEGFQCAIYFCLNSYSAKASNGNLNSNITATYAPPGGTPLGNGTDPVNKFGYVTNLIFDRPASFLNSSDSSSNNTFSVPRSTIGILAQYLEHFFTGYEAIRDSDPSAPSVASEPLNVVENVTQTVTPFTNDTMSVFSNQTYINVPAIMDGLVTTMTNYIRHAAAAAGQAEADTAVVGAAYTLIPLTRVDWRWLTLPIALIVFAVVFLLYTAILSARLGVPVWKDSALAVLFHGLDEGMLNSVAASHGQTLTRRQMDRVAKKSSVVLCRKDGGDIKLVEGIL